ncbi:MAG: hypothetical protein ABGZ17_00410 [Planctomycetaceae bacterium]
MPIRITASDIHRVDLSTRLPFQYGIATMTECPHVFVRITVDIDGHTARGIAADQLPPKWFTKIPDQPLDTEIDEMLAVVTQAAQTAIGRSAPTAFALWHALWLDLSDWGRAQAFPPLLSQFGSALVERALIEAIARHTGQPFHRLMREDRLGIDLGLIHSELAGTRVADHLPRHTRNQVVARHTVGLADPLSAQDIRAGDRLDDGLPQSLDECIDRYHLKHFKLKLSGQIERDIQRLASITDILENLAESNYAVSVDGNEQFQSLDGFRDFWNELTNTECLQRLLPHLMFVEQPFHRDVALQREPLAQMAEWTDRPLLIIDESDSDLGSLQTALQLGYHGTSHKNCKGVFKSIANACLLSHRRRNNPGFTTVISGEDLANIGPVGLLQDLAVAAALGIESVERNGHHYFAGLSQFPAAVQQQVFQRHGDLYRPSAAGWPSLDIQQGTLNLTSVNQAPLGLGFVLDVEQFSPVAEFR